MEKNKTIYIAFFYAEKAFDNMQYNTSNRKGTLLQLLGQKKVFTMRKDGKCFKF